ncbi:large ribosomal subunit protein eL13x-like [Aegilops tauschii subsp. strangulata]|uniref:large ribosomal subunit protein eL13x-like n=1 Tax=Aegilops tauschii subsp. strangulata TaxID=200361 RepID=UPI00098A132A|nr:60S ribosomal protein L13-3-like [Aegilops tauschii subsp. strangulata]
MAAGSLDTWSSAPPEQAANILKKLVLTVGISLDQRRKNMSLEGAGDSTPDELSRTIQVQDDSHGGKKHFVEVVKAIDDVNAYKVYDKLRVERMNWHQLGAWMKMATRMEKEEKK